MLVCEIGDQIPKEPKTPQLKPTPSMTDYNQKIHINRPGFVETEFRKQFKAAIPLRTMVVNCFDPRATGALAAVAREFGEAYPGEMVVDDIGRNVGHTTSIMPVSVAGMLST